MQWRATYGTYLLNECQNTLTAENVCQGNQQTPKITTTEIIILMDFLRFASNTLSLSIFSLPGIPLVLILTHILEYMDLKIDPKFYEPLGPQGGENPEFWI